MDKFTAAIDKARHSSFYRMLLNAGLWSRIPFNKPHRLKIIAITDDGFEIRMPYTRKNMNHLRGLHACGLATLSEYAAGLTLMRKIGFTGYRLIMESITVNYYYQAKMPVIAAFGLSDEWIATHVKTPLAVTDAVFVDLNVDIRDLQGNHICTGTTRWQIKRWDKVKTKV